MTIAMLVAGLILAVMPMAIAIVLLVIVIMGFSRTKSEIATLRADLQRCTLSVPNDDSHSER